MSVSSHLATFSPLEQNSLYEVADQSSCLFNKKSSSDKGNKDTKIKT